MASTNKTVNLGLSQWDAGDAALMSDFNSDNAKIDAAVAELRTSAAGPRMVKLADVTLTESKKKVEIVFNTDTAERKYVEYLIYFPFETNMDITDVRNTKLFDYATGEWSSAILPVFSLEGFVRIRVYPATATTVPLWYIPSWVGMFRFTPDVNQTLIFTRTTSFKVGDRFSIIGIER